MAKSNRTNRDGRTDGPPENQPDTAGTDAANLPVDDDLITDVDGFDTSALPIDDTDESVQTVDSDKTVDPGEDTVSTSDNDDVSDEDVSNVAESSKDKTVASDSSAAASSAAKTTGRNRKATGNAKGSPGKNAGKSTEKSGNPAKRASNRKTSSYTSTPGTQTIKPNARWFVPTMVTVLLLGLVWLVVFYISSGAYPVGAWGYWNLGVGFAILVAGLVMSTRWR